MTHPAGYKDVPPRPAPRALPESLEAIEIPTPCEVPWSSLRGDDRVRSCGRCRKNVYNVSEMPRAEAMHLIRKNEGRVCLRIHRRPDGTVVTGDCWSRLRAARQRGLLPFFGVLAATAWIQFAGGARGVFERGIQLAEAGAVGAKGRDKGEKSAPKKEKEKQKSPPSEGRPDDPGEPRMGAPMIE